MARIATLSLVLLAFAAAPAAATEFPDPPVAQPVPSGPTADLPDVQVGPTGETVLAWRSDTSASVETAVRPFGGGWVDEPVLITGGLGGNPPALFLDGDRTIVVSNTGGKLTVVTRLPGGSWSAPQVIDGVLADPRENVAVHAGRVAAIWTVGDGPLTIRATHAAIGGAAIAPDDIKTIGVAEFGGLAASVDGTGRAIVAYTDNGEDDVEIAESGPGDAAFGTPAEVDTTAENYGRPQLATDAAGNVHMTYWRKSASGYELVYRRRPPGSSPFGAAEIVGDFPTGMFKPVDDPLVVSPDGTVTTFTRVGDLLAHTRPPGGSFPDPQPHRLSGGGGLPRVAEAGPDGSVGVVFGAGADFLQSVAVRRPGQPWGAAQRLIPHDQAGSVALSFGPTGDAAAAWSRFDTNVVEATIGDSGQPPALSLTAPATFRFGQPVTVGLTATDFSGVASSGFGFSDGTNAGGTRATHTFAGATRYSVTAAATDNLGNVASTSRDLTPVIDPVCACLPPEPGPTPRRRRTKRPDANIDRVRSPVRTRALTRFRGTASDELGLRNVEISLVRTSGGARFTASTAARRCSVLRSSGRVTRTAIRRGRCRPAGFLRATGTTRWSFRLKRRLPRGTYVLVARARAADGTLEQGFSASDRNLVRFRVR